MSRSTWQRALERLTPRDLDILDDLERYRVLTTRQIQRLYWPRPEHRPLTGVTRATQLVMRRLEERGVVGRLERRAGGRKAGSQGIVWQLTSVGSTIQQYRSGQGGRHRYREPGPAFVDHTLEVANVAVRARELERDGQLELRLLQPEPDAWRSFTGPFGQAATLKPDLALVTASGEFEDHYFIEVDRSTEHITRIVAKCATYVRYAATGAEQNAHGVFPRVVWLTPDEARAAEIRRAIEKDAALPSELFIALLVAGFGDLLLDPPQ